MINAINKAISGTGLSLNATFANSSLFIHIHQDSQIHRVDFIQQILNYCDHSIRSNGMTLYLVDMVSGITPAIELNKFEIISINSSFNRNRFTKFSMNVPILEFSKVGGIPTLLQTSELIEASTGVAEGVESKVSYLSQAVNLSVSTIQYPYFTDISTILTRKSVQYNKQDIAIEINGILNIVVGQSVYFDAIDDGSIDNDGSGNFVVADIRYNIKNLTTTLKGKGTFTPIIK
jgi:hypothetical protein